ncbi:MAG: integrase core domain-containing protein [Pseudonocardiaceae bacterium]
MIATLRRELLDRILIANERHLRQIIAAYLHHFNAARPHRAHRWRHDVRGQARATADRELSHRFRFRLGLVAAECAGVIFLL